MLINKIEEPPNITATFMPKIRKQPMYDKRKSIYKSLALSNKTAQQQYFSTTRQEKYP